MNLIYWLVHKRIDICGAHDAKRMGGISSRPAPLVTFKFLSLHSTAFTYEARLEKLSLRLAWALWVDIKVTPSDVFLDIWREDRRKIWCKNTIDILSCICSSVAITYGIWVGVSTSALRFKKRPEMFRMCFDIVLYSLYIVFITFFVNLSNRLEIHFRRVGLRGFCKLCTALWDFPFLWGGGLNLGAIVDILNFYMSS